MDSETRVCQNCKNRFTIEPEDFAFYEKVKVPPPTFCPQCRLQRRMTWRNERSLYKRKCYAPSHGEETISAYDPSKPFVTYDSKYWWSDAWDLLDYGASYDFNRPFFAQFRSLLEKVPLLALVNINPVDTEYANWADGNKNCYLIFGSGWNENISYSSRSMNSKDSLDIFVASKNERCYECVNCSESYRLFYSVNCKSCTDSYFLHNCRNCSNCFGCANLVSKSYHIFNQPYSKEEYFKKLKEFNFGDRNEVARVREKFNREIYLNAIHRYAHIIASKNCTGDNINNSKNCQFCFDSLRNVEDSKYQMGSLELKDSYDGIGQYKTELSTENVDNNVGSREISNVTVYESHDVRYSLNCHASSNLFGCIGLRKKHYCILNRQYKKEEYEVLLPKIIAHMNEMPYRDIRGREYRYGEFFPIELSPFAYNETIAQEYFPLTKDQAETSGFSWKDSEQKGYTVTLPADKVPSAISEVPDSILGEVIGCAHKGVCHEQCTTAFKIVSNELQFYRNMQVPLPILCPNCRHYARLAKRNPMRLWHRKCQCVGAKSENGIYANTISHVHGESVCPNEFETTYAPDRAEIVYCEQCYNAEVV